MILISVKLDETNKDVTINSKGELKYKKIKIGDVVSIEKPTSIYCGGFPVSLTNESKSDNSCPCTCTNYSDESTK
ncbi:MAG: hypothetical protein LBV53_01520 [Mycoplasmataceae bacterium]|jgi:hypothetical protein|nr:hypothetical protein [Mycoplasmataceae bacterium]